MNLSRLDGGESNPIYQDMASSNLDRYYSYIDSRVQVALKLQKKSLLLEPLSESFIKTVNLHATADLHKGAGEYRSTPVRVGKHTPPNWKKSQG